ncbi:MAG: hypothetical protein GY830_10925 [Bacteroidetes bacterium]|nr:hypothetical protein [Bacteroidota bacterium]
MNNFISQKIKLFLFFSSIFIFSSCNISNGRRENRNLKLKIREAGKPQIIKEKIPKAKYDKVIDKGIKILNDTIQIPEGVKNKEAHEQARKEFKDHLNKIKEVDGENQYLIKYSGLMLQKSWLKDVKNSLNKQKSHGKYDKSKNNLNNYLKGIAENDAKWKNFVNGHLRFMFDLLVQKERTVLNDDDILKEKGEEKVKNTILEGIKSQQKLCDTYFDLCKNNRDIFVKLIFKSDPKQNYFQNLVNYITKKMCGLLDNLSTFGALKARLRSTTKSYLRVDPEGNAFYALGKFLEETKNTVLDVLRKDITDGNNKGIINNLNGSYNTLNSLGYTFMGANLVLAKHVSGSKKTAVIEMFKVYIDILKKLLNKFKLNINKVVDEFLGKDKPAAEVPNRAEKK